LTLADLKAEALRGIERHAATSLAVAEMCGSLDKGQRVGGKDIREAVGEFANQGALDVDILPMVVSSQRTEGEYLFDHCVNVALISMSMGVQAGLDRSHIMEIGFGAMLQDIGMMRVPTELRLAPRVLLSDELVEIRRHPILTLDWLEKLKGVPLRAGFIGYQSHERADGKGYPRQRAPMLVHPFAKIVGVADSFTAMMRTRPYRPPLGAYGAAKAILEDLGKFDRTTVRLFLDTVGLFPIGSCVELDNGIQGKVTRATPGQHARPVIEELGTDGRLTGRLLDLSRDTTVQIARPIECPNAGLLSAEQ
jgi:HD-GYP domain-containing protein (c-di-GMP phosphodiesterase class II)